MGYLGSKGGSGVYQKIISMMPRHRIYIEAFLGEGAIIRNKPAAEKNIGFDLNVDALIFVRNELYQAGIEFQGYQTDSMASLRDWKRGEVFNWQDVLIYADPPYLLETRTSAARYQHEYTEPQHHAMIDTLRALPGARVMISGYRSDLYDSLLSDWRREDFQAMTRGGVRTESVWLNFDESAPAYSHSFAGRDYKERQRIKRKAERWAEKYRNLPERERLAIMSEMMKEK
ncbi:DNA adenine methylase [Acerihabitans arboris]|uniref:site-specific DNA-methyltransferase (adenine-specific) n=1 Tax=Acerihabitans arboris TaxID=2691583 RepID=A0A845SNP1_9GAMM|nr:DNA adenine methylase [Acerihabitans arboris]NDL64817.1 DNA adenine methylase [Acerihabitans arboris]